MKNTPVTSVLKLPLLVYHHKVVELILSITYFPSVIISGNTLNWRIDKCEYGKFCHRYNAFPIRLHAFWCGEFYLLKSGQRLHKV
jgi:hypothetical protein